MGELDATLVERLHVVHARRVFLVYEENVFLTLELTTSACLL